MTSDQREKCRLLRTVWNFECDRAFRKSKVSSGIWDSGVSGEQLTLEFVLCGALNLYS